MWGAVFRNAAALNVDAVLLAIALRRSSGSAGNSRQWAWHSGTPGARNAPEEPLGRRPYTYAHEEGRLLRRWH